MRRSVFFNPRKVFFIFGWLDDSRSFLGGEGKRMKGNRAKYSLGLLNFHRVFDFHV